MTTDAQTAGESLTVGEYLRLVFGDPLTVGGVLFGLVGSIVVFAAPRVAALATWGRYGGFVSVLGVLLFAVGYTRAQHRVKQLRTRAD